MSIEAWLRRLEARAAEKTGEDPLVIAEIDRSVRQLIAECERTGIDWQEVVRSVVEEEGLLR